MPRTQRPASSTPPAREDERPVTAPAVNRSVPSRRQGGGSADGGVCATTGSRTSRDHRPRQARPPTTRHHLGRALRLGLATALTAGLSGAVALLAQAAGNTLVFTHNGTAQATYGVNGAVYVDGTIMVDLACSFAATPGIDDFVYPATDVYIVTAGSATAGAKLTAPRPLPLRPGGRRTSGTSARSPAGRPHRGAARPASARRSAPSYICMRTTLNLQTGCSRSRRRALPATVARFPACRRVVRLAAITQRGRAASTLPAPRRRALSVPTA